MQSMSYYKGWFWPGILVQSSNWALNRGHHDLMLPDLNRFGDYADLYQAGDQGLVNWWTGLEIKWQEARNDSTAATA